MKKSLVALAVLAASGASFAQSNVTLYGIGDIWFGSQKTSGLSQTKLDSGGLSGSRWGMKGSEDLGGGLKANFQFESGFDLSTGAGSGNLFGRQAYVGFSGGFGEVKFGNVYTAYDDVNGAGNSVFDSAFSAASNVFKSAGYTSNPKNNIYYASPNFGGISGAVSYALGENKTATVGAGSTTALHVKYEGGPLFVSLGYQTEKATGATSASKYTRLNGTYDLGVAKVYAGIGHYAMGVNSANDYTVGADFPVSSALTLSAGYARSKDNAAAGGAKRTGYGLGALYSLSKRTDLYAGYNSNKTAGATSDTLIAVGVRHSF